MSGMNTPRRGRFMSFFNFLTNPNGRTRPHTPHFESRGTINMPKDLNDPSIEQIAQVN